MLGTVTWLQSNILQQHGCFSVDREGTDMPAFRHAVAILKEKINPLVIFPEGEVYHINERVTPFREGPAAIVLTPSKKWTGQWYAFSVEYGTNTPPILCPDCWYSWSRRSVISTGAST